MYIRTKDGVYELVDNLYQYHNGVEKFWYAKKENGKTLAIEITAGKILKQSENLEKLCDDFVGLIKDRNSDFIITKVIAHSLKELKDSLKTEFNGKTYYGKFDIIYGCIWTDKGLIYVAKMDNEGKLVLI